MNYVDKFSKAYVNIHYKPTQKFYYKKKPFKLFPVRNPRGLINFGFKSIIKGIVAYEPKPKVKSIFKSEKDWKTFIHRLRFGGYFENECDLVYHLKTLKSYVEITKCYGPTVNIFGPVDTKHLEDLSNLQYKKNIPIKNIKLNEVLRKPVHVGFRYKLSGYLTLSELPNGKNDHKLKSEIESFVELFGGIENENVKFTGNIHKIIQGEMTIHDLFKYASRYSIPRVSFTIHFKTTDELMSLNFIKDGIGNLIAVEYVK
jgi:hypothetical protein